MARMAFFEINCVRYSENIIDIIMLFNDIGWTFNNLDGYTEYLPVGDDDQYDWQKDQILQQDVYKLINDKQAKNEQVGINLYYQNTEQGVTLLVRDTKEIMINLCINRKTIDGIRESITDFNWYFENIIQKLIEKGCIIDQIIFEDYVD